MAFLHIAVQLTVGAQNIAEGCLENEMALAALNSNQLNENEHTSTINS